VFRRLCIALGFILTCQVATASDPRWCAITDKNATDTFVYPPVAQAAHLVGEVLTRLTFDPDGEVLGVSTIRGENLLADLTNQQLLKWRVKTSALGSEPCQNIVLVTYELVDEKASTETSVTFSPTLIRITVKAALPVVDMIISDPVSKRKRHFWVF
jgi:Gram-negative bacterial TonB protein C-terminal